MFEINVRLAGLRIYIVATMSILNNILCRSNDNLIH